MRVFTHQRSDFSRLAALVLVLVAGGCKSLNGTGPLSWTWTRERGVCSHVDLSTSFKDGGVAACARTRPAATGLEAYLYAEIAASDGDHWRSEDWQVGVLRPDGSVLLDHADLRPQPRPCMVVYGVVRCMSLLEARVAIGEQWRAGTYVVRYSYVPENRYVDVSLTLE